MSTRHWQDSLLPFFVVLRQSVTHGDNKDSKGELDQVSPLHYLYPEVRYVFDDDDFSPAIELLEQQDDDVSVIVDFDYDGKSVTGFESLSPNWQPLEVTTATSSAPKWAKHPNSSTSMVFIDGISSQSDIPNVSANAKEKDAELPAADILQNLKAKVNQFKMRNEQLREIVYPNGR